MRRLVSIGVMIGAGLLAAGCTAGASSSATAGSSTSGGGTKAAGNSTLIMDNENGANWTCGFNPYNSAVNFLIVGFTYEPLVYVNPLQSGKTTPMLATSYSWGPDDKSLTFSIRQGVTWSDGQPFTASDVAYTFNLLKKNGAMDLNGIWSVLSGVTASGTSTVTMTFKAPAVPYFYYIADQTPIVPEHQWAKFSNPATATVPDPIGTGPYVMSKCSPQNITFTANPRYWQPGLPKIHTLQYPAYLTNTVANNDLANGSASWGSQYIPDIQSFYLSKSPSYHYWFPPTVNLTLIPNLTDPQLSNVKVRQAISYAINRAQVSQIGESGYEPPANQTGVVTPTFSSMLDNAAVTAWGNGYDPAKAKTLLAQAGYHQGPDGVMVNSAGQRLAFSISVNGGFSDWVASVQVIEQDLKAVGIEATTHNLSANAFNTDLVQGHFQFAFYDQQTFGPSPYYELNNWLNSAATAPIGQTAGTNYERYKNAATDSVLQQYAGTTDSATQQSLLNQIQMTMITQVPIIPVLEAVDWFQYDTAKFSGWPTASDPYAQPAIYSFPDNEQVLLHLAPAQ